MSSSLVKHEPKALVSYNSVKDLVKKKRIILEENEFIARIDQIIERDFFPDLYQLRQEREKSNNRHKFLDQNISNSKIIFSPTSFETPFESNKQNEPESVTSQSVNYENLKSNSFDCNLSLNEFFNKYTSEDDASFDDIMKEAEKRHRTKYPWLYRNENDETNRFKESLALASNSLKEIESSKSAGVITWPYRNKNSVMFVPEGPEIDKTSFNICSNVAHENTRFKVNPFNTQLSEEKMVRAAILNAKEREGKIGIDGKEISKTPRIGDYSFVSMTPSPSPGVNNTPLMTWGYIENTPYILDGSETLSSVKSTPNAQQFKIPDIPEREKVAHTLADKMTKQNRNKKEEAFKNAQYLKSSPLINNRIKSPFERLSSPAAQKLKKLKSASPSFSRINTPQKFIITTPSLTYNSDSSSLTDNLLKLPNRK